VGIHASNKFDFAKRRHAFGPSGLKVTSPKKNSQQEGLRYTLGTYEILRHSRDLVRDMGMNVFLLIVQKKTYTNI